MAGALDRSGLGGSGAGDPDFIVGRGRRAAGNSHRGDAVGDPAPSEGGGAAAAAARQKRAQPRPAAADAFHCDQHVGGIAAALAAIAARATACLLQRAGHRLHGDRGERGLRRLLSCRRLADSVRRCAPLHHAAIVSRLYRAQRTRDGRSAGLRARARGRPDPHHHPCRPRPDVDRRDRRHAGLWRPPHPRGDAVSATTSELWPYLALVLVGFLPNEVWRLLGLVLARGLNEDSQLVVLARAIATAILAGVIAKLVLFSAGALAAVPLAVRVGAAVLGFIAFLAVRRSVFAGVAVGEAALLLGGWLFAR